MDELKNFFNLANSHHPFLKFTYEISHNSTTFLDLHIFKGKRFVEKNILDLKTYFKPTNSFLYLHRTSCHNKSVFAGFIKGEVIRHARNTNNQEDLDNILLQFRSNLVDRGYKEEELTKYMNQALSKDRSSLLIKSNKKAMDIPLCFKTNYNPCIRKLRHVILKHWHLLKMDEDCRNIFFFKKTR